MKYAVALALILTHATPVLAQSAVHCCMPPMSEHEKMEQSRRVDEARMSMFEHDNSGPVRQCLPGSAGCEAYDNRDDFKPGCIRMAPKHEPARSQWIATCMKPNP
jgi:hypothetical protein